MTQYYTDFSEYSTGGTPSGWSVLDTDTTSASTFTVLSDSNMTGGQYLEIDTNGETSGNEHGLVWDDVGTPTDVEIVAKWRTTINGQYLAQQYTRATVDSSGLNCYVTEPIVDNDGIDFSYYLDNTWTDIDSYNMTIDTNTWYWTRTRINGSDIYIKAWQDGNSEPSSWDLTLSDSNISSGGGAGIGIYDSGKDSSIDVFGVGTSGDTAPTEPLGVDVTGTVTMDGSAISGATIIGINDTQEIVEDTTTTDSNGDYTLSMTTGDTAHILMQYDDGTDQYNAESKPFIVNE